MTKVQWALACLTIVPASLAALGILLMIPWRSLRPDRPDVSTASEQEKA